MSGAIVLLIVNTAVAGLFAACYFIITLISHRQRAVHVFGISYLIGMLTPLSELGLRLSGFAWPLMVISYGALLAGFLVMAVALALFTGNTPPLKAVAATALCGLLLRGLIWGGTRDQLAYEMAYQFPFVLALVLCGYTSLKNAAGRPLHYLLAGLFTAVAINFSIKPFVAAALGSGRTVHDYAASNYALFSQATTGILLIAAGLVVLLIVLQATVHDYTHAAETDHLSGLLNRRGFDRRAQTILATTGDVAVIMMDLDHFKSINDSFGHDVGDRVITAFAKVLRHTVPGSAVLARTGGEEFVALLEAASLRSAVLIGEAVRQQVAGLAIEDLPPFTFSAGVAKVVAGEKLSDLMRRADQACYCAKQDGRNRIVSADVESTTSGLSNVVHLRLVL